MQRTDDFSLLTLHLNNPLNNALLPLLLVSSQINQPTATMSFYAYPYYPVQRRQSPTYPHPAAFASSPFALPAAYHPTASPVYGYDHEDIEAEERAALAHLRAIQQRKEAAQLAARREAAIQARIEAEREAAFAAAIERERARQEAIRQEAARQEAIRRAVAIEQHRQELLRRRQAAIAAQQEAARRAIECRKQDEARKRIACARRCAEGCGRSPVSTPKETKEDSHEEDSHDEWKQINDILGSLFGFNFVPETTTTEETKESTEEKKEEPKPVEVKEAPKPVEAPKVEENPKDKAEEKARVSTPAKEDKAEPKPATDAKAEIDLNDLISSFLGFNVQPATSEDKSTPGAENITNRLNDFLNQFGLEFEPLSEEKVESSSSAPKPTVSPRPTPAPATPKEDVKPAPAVEGKGKAVAEGEKPAKSAQPSVETAPAPDPKVALNKLRDISQELHLVTQSFTFPEHLAFASTPASDDVVPPLLFNKQNSKYHAQAHKLLQLLLAVDGVSSGGDREVRKQRKALVKAIEGAIEGLEKKRDEAWQEVKERRDRGEESDDEGSVSSWATETPEDHPTSPAEPEVTPQPVEQEQPTERSEEVQGFEVPSATEQAAEKTEQVEVIEETKAEDNEAKDTTEREVSGDATKAEAKPSSEKEEGYELL